MVDFNKVIKCKICQKIGSSLYKIKYSDNELVFFLKKYYGSEKYEILKNRLININFNLIKCDSCKFIWQEYSPIEKLSFDLYDNVIDNKKSLKKSEIKFQNKKNKYNDEISFIINQFNNTKINILDFGAGWGHWVNSGDKNTYNPYAFELSNSRKKYLLKLGINVLDNTKIKNFYNYFHFIRLDQVLEHLDNLQDVLKLIKKLAKKKCIFYLSVPDGNKIFDNISNIKIEKGPIQPLEHLNCFSRYSINKLLSQEGFVSIKFLEIFFMHMKSLLRGKISLNLFLKDVKDCFISTSIKFKIK